MQQSTQPGWNRRFLSWFGFIMVIAYITLGIVVLTGSYFRNSMPGKYQIALGCLLIIYGLFRGWRVIKDRKSPSED